MGGGILVKADHVSKKYCKSLKQSMFYGMTDIGRNMLRLGSKPEVLRKDEFWAVNDVSFELRRGETLGLIGSNGSGKTSLLKILNGIFWPDKGEITIRGRVGALIAVGAGFHPVLTGRENIYVNGAILGMTKRELDKKFDAIVDFADIGDFLDTPVKYYSSGMFVRLGFAVAVHCDPDILLIDEVLAVGDEGFQTKCCNKIGELKANGTATILVSHNMHSISTFCTQAILMKQGKLFSFENVDLAVQSYISSFFLKNEFSEERLVSGNSQIDFSDVKVQSNLIEPLSSIGVYLQYDSKIEYEDVEIDVVIYNSREVGTYFQATNKSFDQKIDLKTGKHNLNIAIHDVPINGAIVKFTVAIWLAERKEMLFWTRLPIEFKSFPGSTGRNYLKVSFLHS